MPWTFFLTMTNGTPRTLELLSSNLNWGFWYLNGSDDVAPISIGANETKQVLGIRAARGTATGYECSATWKDVVPGGQKPYGTVDFSIDVPYDGTNSSRMAPIAPLKVDGWSDIPPDGHDFTRNITVSIEGDQLVARPGEEHPAPAPTPVRDDDDRRQAAWAAAFSTANPDLTDYAETLSLPEAQTFNVVDNLPKTLELPPVKVLIARSPVLVIPHSEWRGFADPVFSTMYSRDLFVDEYRTLAVYAVNCNPRDVVSLVPGEEYKFTKRTEITLFIRTLETNTWSLKTALSAEGTNPTQTAKVAASIESSFGVEDVLEGSSNRVSEEVLEETFKAPEDRGQIIVPYVFSTIALIYRVRKDKTIPPELIAVSEWAQFQIEKTFDF